MASSELYENVFGPLESENLGADAADKHKQVVALLFALAGGFSMGKSFEGSTCFF